MRTSIKLTVVLFAFASPVASFAIVPILATQSAAKATLDATKTMPETSKPTPDKGNAGYLRKQVDGWFAEAKPAAKGVWLTDAKGCLVSAIDDGKGIKLVKMLDDHKQPICRK